MMKNKDSRETNDKCKRQMTDFDGRFFFSSYMKRKKSGRRNPSSDVYMCVFLPFWWIKMIRTGHARLADIYVTDSACIMPDTVNTANN